MKAKRNFKIREPGFLTALVSIANVFGNYYVSEHPFLEDEADRDAIANDWRTIGTDMNNVLKSTFYILKSSSHERRQ